MISLEFSISKHFNQIILLCILLGVCNCSYAYSASTKEVKKVEKYINYIEQNRCDALFDDMLHPYMLQSMDKNLYPKIVVKENRLKLIQQWHKECEGVYKDANNNKVPLRYIYLPKGSKWKIIEAKKHSLGADVFVKVEYTEDKAICRGSNLIKSAIYEVSIHNQDRKMLIGDIDLIDGGREYFSSPCSEYP